MVKFDRRRRPTPRWDPPSRTNETTATVQRLARSLAIAAALRTKETTNAQ